MRRPAHPFRAALIVLLVAAVVLGMVFRGTVSENTRALGVLSTTLPIPVASWFVAAVTHEPRLEETSISGVPTTVARPGGSDGPWPALVFVNGATRRGRHHPAVRRLARSLARAGYLVLVPDVPGLRRGEITRRTLAATIVVAHAAAVRPDAKGARVGFAGVSVGATLALLAAEDPSLAHRTAVVAGIAPYTDLEAVIRLATTGRYRTPHGLVRFDAKPFLALVIARSLVGALPPGRDRDELRTRLLAVPDDAGNPLAALRSWPRSRLRPEARALVRLLANRDPDRFDDLYAELPRPLRAGIERLSPIRGASRIRARVELASAPRDKYFPLEESRALLARVRNGRLTVTSTLHHAVPHVSIQDVADLFRFYGFIVRTLRDARDAGDPTGKR